jgi:nicotinic acid phosphoribosyltransferase
LVIRPDSGDPVEILCGKRWNDEQNPYDENADLNQAGNKKLANSDFV